MDTPSGERLLPERQRGQMIYAEHVSRYRFASQFVTDKRVLDAACGEGYGSAMLAASGAAEVVGTDIDEATIEQARSKYDLEFATGDVTALPFPDNQFDVVVSFETIEHVDNAEQMLTEVRRVLAPNGLLVISTPNSTEYLLDNAFHVREFTSEEFTELIGDRFGPVTIFRQHGWLVSAVLGEAQFNSHDESVPLDADLYKSASGVPSGELYTVAVCGAIDPHEVREVVWAADVYEANRMLEWVDRSLLAEKRLDDARAEVEHYEIQLARASERLVGLEQSLDSLKKSISWRATQPLRAVAGAIRQRPR